MSDPRTLARLFPASILSRLPRQWPLKAHLALFAAILILPAAIFTGILIKHFADLIT